MAIRVFLADDHAVVRDGLRLLLQAHPGIDVVGDAGDGKEVVRLVAALKPDIVVMDVAMPGMNGIEATRRIQEVCPSARVIMLSMHSSPEYAIRALEAGARGYVLKESAGQEVARAVRAVADGRRYLTERLSDEMMDGYVGRGLQPRSCDSLERLTSREREVLQMVVDGKSSSEIAKVLFLSPKTVETYRSRLMQKLDIHDVPSLVKFAVQRGLTTL